MNKIPENNLTAHSRYDDPGCFMLLWKYFAIFTVLLCVSIFLLAWAAEADPKDVLLPLVHFQSACAAFIGLSHLAAFLQNKHPAIIIAANPQGITITRRKMFRPPSTELLPLSEITYIAAIGDELNILTGRQVHKFPHIRDAGAFAAAAVPYLRGFGANIDKTAREKAAETTALTERWKQRQAARKAGLLPPEHKESEIPMPAPNLPQTTDETGAPILPQQLTAEQADGVFIPAEQKPADAEHQQMQQ